jgi:hypothetical protein
MERLRSADINGPDINGPDINGPDINGGVLATRIGSVSLAYLAGQCDFRAGQRASLASIACVINAVRPACSRDSRPSLVRMAETCRFAVRSLTCNSRASERLS